MYELTSIDPHFQAGVPCLAASESRLRVAGDALKSVSGGSENDENREDEDFGDLHDGTFCLQLNYFHAVIAWNVFQIWKSPDLKNVSSGRSGVVFKERLALSLHH